MAKRIPELFLFAFALAAALPSAADVVRVECPVAEAEVVVAAPWGKDAQPGDVVEKMNLGGGTKLLRWDGKAWAEWTFASGKWTRSAAPAKREKPAKDGALASGEAFVLVRKGDLKKPFTVDAKPAKGQKVETGSAEEPAETLVAAAFELDFDLNGRDVSEWTACGVASGDQVRIFEKGEWRTFAFKGVGVTLDQVGWGVVSEDDSASFEKGAVVPAGTPFWYVSRGGEGQVSLEWGL